MLYALYSALITRSDDGGETAAASSTCGADGRGTTGQGGQWRGDMASAQRRGRWRGRW